MLDLIHKISYSLRINDCKKKIKELEDKRARSQGMLVEAILTHKSPSDEDVDWFNKYTEMINSTRDEMIKLERERDELIKGKKKKSDGEEKPAEAPAPAPAPAAEPKKEEKEAPKE